MEFVKIAVLDNTFEADMLTAVLDENRVPHLIRTYEDEAYGTLFQTTKGWGAVLAPEQHREEIKRLLDELRRSRSELYEQDKEKQPPSE